MHSEAASLEASGAGFEFEVGDTSDTLPSGSSPLGKEALVGAASALLGRFVRKREVGVETAEGGRTFRSVLEVAPDRTLGDVMAAGGRAFTDLNGGGADGFVDLRVRFLEPEGAGSESRRGVPSATVELTASDASRWGSAFRRQLARLIVLLAQTPEARFDDVCLLTPDERAALRDFGKPGVALDAYAVPAPGETLVTAFEEVVRRCPDRPAVLFGDHALTYRRLDELSNALAHRIIERGGPDPAVVAIAAMRSPEIVVAQLAVLKAGAAYLPVDPNYPPDRWRFMLEDADAALLLVGDGVDVPGNVRCPKMALRARDLAPCANPPAVRVEPETTAYVLYTSGSTGKPKGILTTHGNVLGLVRGNNYLAVRADDVFLQLSNFVFDGATFDFYAPLLNGAGVAMVDEEVLSDPAAIGEEIRRHRVTVFFVTTALFNALVDVDPGLLRPVRKVLFGGERASFHHVRRALEEVGPGRLMHVYGPTETTVFATFFPVDRLDPGLGAVPIGYPVTGREIEIVDPDGHPCPVGVPGELVVRGPGVAKGYLNRPELNRERFGRAADVRLYRTGDVAWWDAAGAVVFGGREDGQVKVRGYRIELGEVESALVSHPRVRKALVVARASGEGVKELCAYVEAPEEVSAEELGGFLRGKLPPHMVPPYFVVLRSFPLNPNGKVDLRALPEPTEGAPTAGGEPPADELEARLLAVWAGVFGRSELGVTDDFFALGGTSLKAIRILGTIREEMGRTVRISELLGAPTVRGLARLISAGRPQALPKLEAGSREGAYPATNVQERLYAIQALQPDSREYNITEVLSLSGRPDARRLEAAFGRVVARHEALRTRFGLRDGSLVQEVVPAEEIEVRVEERECASDGLPAEIERCARPLALDRAPLWRLTLVATAEGEHLLVLVIHHTVADGVSVQIVLDEWRACAEGRTLPPVEYQFGDWQRAEGALGSAREAALGHWRKVFADGAPALPLPTDFVRPARRSGRGAAHFFGLDEGDRERLHAESRRLGVTPYVYLLTALFLYLRRLTGQTDVVVGTPVAGRVLPRSEGIVGMFVNTLPLRLAPNPGLARFSEVLAHVREVALGAFDHELLPLDELVSEVCPERDASRNPLFDVMLGYQDVLRFDGSFGGVDARRRRVGNGTSKLDLNFEVEDHPDGLRCRLEYDLALFEAPTAERIATGFGRMLAAVLADAEADADAVLLGEPAVDRPEQATHARRAEGKPSHVLSRVEEAAKRFPERPAVRLGDDALSYGELWERSSELLEGLGAEGVGAGDVVALGAAPSLDLIPAVLAAWRAGAAYLPLDPELPQRRREFVLGDAGVRALIEPGSDGLARPRSVAPRGGATAAPLPGTTSAGDRELGRPAYLVYTSGTTGEPKGVLVEHGGLANYVAWFERFAGLTSDDGSAVVSSFAFDLGYTGIYPLLAAGGCVRLVDKADVLDPDRLLERLAADRTTVVKLTPSLFGLVVDSPAFERWAERLALRLVVLGGEPLKPRDVARFRELLPRTRVANHYGPTECTIGCVSDDVDAEWLDPRRAASVIGRPIAGTGAFVIDANDRPSVPGAVGQLVVGGAGVARGYHRREAATAERFVALPALGGGRFYRTGDLARWRHDGTLEFRGRRDDQVKLGGYRIELAEVEAKLRLLVPGADAFAAVVDAGGQPALHAFVANATGGATAPTSLRARLGAELPPYMVPQRLHVLDRLPRTPNGKVDGRALKDLAARPPEEVPGDVPAEPPAGSAHADGLVSRLVDLWSRLLPGQTVDPRATFFEQGMNSLGMVRAHTELARLFPGRLAVADLFSHPTIEQLARLLREREPARAAELPRLALPTLPATSAADDRGTDVETVHLGRDDLERVLQANGLDEAARDAFVLAAVALVLGRAAKTPTVDLPFTLDGLVLKQVTIGVAKAETLAELVGGVRRAMLDAADLGALAGLSPPPAVANRASVGAALGPAARGAADRPLFDLWLAAPAAGAEDGLTLEWRWRRARLSRPIVRKLALAEQDLLGQLAAHASKETA